MAKVYLTSIGIFLFLSEVIMKINSIYSTSMSVNFVFIHMRKAGGTSMIDNLDLWLKSLECLKPNQHFTVLGVRNGITYKQHSPETTLCHNINIIHNEFRCVNAEHIIHTIAPRHERTSNIKFFTTFRHPIARLISQAFYADCFASRRVKDFIAKNCGIRTENKDCKREASLLALESIRQDDEAWFNWTKSSQGFGDGYMSNYYIRRFRPLDSTTNMHWSLKLKSLATPSLAADVLSYSYRENGGGASSLHDTNITNSSNYDIMAHFLNTGCSRQVLEEVLDYEGPLRIATRLLQDHFEVLILELMDTQGGKIMLNHILDSAVSGSDKHQATMSPLHDREGLLHNGEKFVNATDFNITEIALAHMSPRVLDHLIALNQGDIKLYEYAVNLYNKRLHKLLTIR